MESTAFLMPSVRLSTRPAASSEAAALIKTMLRFGPEVFPRRMFFVISAKKWISFYRWYKIYEYFITSSNGTKYCTIPSGSQGIKGELQLTEVFFPLTKGVFEGIEVDLPNNCAAYLTSLYGDYMQLPPIEQRNGVHKIIKIEF